MAKHLPKLKSQIINWFKKSFVIFKELQSVMFSQNSTRFTIESKPDKQKFDVNQNIINASALLKNIYELTEVSESIVVDCSAHALTVFIELVNHYDTVSSEKHDKEFEANFYTKFRDDQIAKLIQDLSIIDSDFFMDSVADYILSKITASRPHMDWEGMMELLGVEENDYTAAERKMINEKQLEYFLAIDMKSLKFPFRNKNFYHLKTKFASPMNAFLARIIQRSSPEISFQISMINKTLKNEIDLYPLKMKTFGSADNSWFLELYDTFCLTVDTHDENFLNVIKKRRIQAEEFSLHFEPSYAESQFCDSLSFAISNSDTKAELKFFECPDQIYLFDITKCVLNPIKIHFELRSEGHRIITFNSVYDHFMKDATKKIEILINGSFGFFQQACLRLYKEPNTTKFHMIYIWFHAKMMPPFKDFIENYMEADGIVKSLDKIHGIPDESCSSIQGRYHFYYVSVVKRYLDDIIISK